MRGGTRRTTPTELTTSVAGLDFQNPIVLAGGTAGYGREMSGVMDLDRMGGLVTKAVSPEPRSGAAPPRVAEFEGGMINAVGLANPGLEEVRSTHLPWIAAHLPHVRVLINVVGSAVEDYVAVVEALTERDGTDAFELNVSCPNVRAGGIEFGADPRSLADVVGQVRTVTRRPIFVKLSPTLADIAATARTAVDAGADGLTLVNTIPGLVIDVETRRPVVGFGSGGISGSGLLPVGVLATWKVRREVGVPLIGVGGVSRGTDALQYLMAGASLVGIGTAAMKDPRVPERVIRELDDWCRAHDVRSISELVGTLEWPA